ncbi:MAG: Uma2 family endonuclease [Hymenobacter sp.]|nr:MAG: Uma2 family endonuclease [Hymenobacter sp.]
MAGASRAHNTIALNMAMALRQGLRNKECLVHMEYVRLAVEDNRHYTHPDVLVSCDPHDQRESQQVYLSQVTMLVACFRRNEAN